MHTQSYDILSIGIIDTRSAIFIYGFIIFLYLYVTKKTPTQPMHLFKSTIWSFMFQSIKNAIEDILQALISWFHKLFTSDELLLNYNDLGQDCELDADYRSSRSNLWSITDSQSPGTTVQHGLLKNPFMKLLSEKKSLTNSKHSLG